MSMKQRIKSNMDEQVIAHKRKYEFADGDKYEVFLKKQVLSLDPLYLGVAKCETLNTDDGPMCRLTLTATLDDPGLEVIAECFINNQYIYFWRDSVWTLGIGTHAEPLRHFFGTDFQAALIATANDQQYISDIQKIVIYPIGTTPAWMLENEL